MDDVVRILEDIIQDFDVNKFKKFFYKKTNDFISQDKPLDGCNDELFDACRQIGTMKVNDVHEFIVIAAKVNRDLTEKSGKKAQYTFAKKILKQLERYTGSFFIFYDSNGNFRFSFIYSIPRPDGRQDWSNFRRYTYYVSKLQTNRTFLQQMEAANFESLDAIIEAFSVEKVTREFYKNIVELYYTLVNNENNKGLQKYPSQSQNDKEEFIIRLLGRLLFCWFLKKKKDNANEALIPEELLSSKNVHNYNDIYHELIEPLFFQVLNTPVGERLEAFSKKPWEKIPFLNGGLFEPHDSDYYPVNQINEMGISPNINILQISNDWFKSLFEVFEQYNFTIDENTLVDTEVSIDPEMLGKIFENLLAEYNPETKENARRATGSYYTPREIVDYMVDESLKNYLCEKTKLSRDIIEELLKHENFEAAANLNEHDKEAIIDAIDKIKVIDPACGSGAFPMGILHKLQVILENVDPQSKIWFKKKIGQIVDPLLQKELQIKLEEENWDYIHKLGLIQHSIYGVDIQPIAVEISKLRFFLSLIVDEKIDDEKQNRGIIPLPNLEFKFVAANTLIGLPPFESSFGDQHDLIQKLKKIRDEYFIVYGQRKKEIEHEFKKTQDQMLQLAVSWRADEKQSFALSSWEPFSFKSNSWFDPEWMFGVKDGFDIVIGNPPYIKEYTNRKAFDGIRNSPYYQGKMDIWYLFACKGIDLLRKDTGVLTFIAQNNWVTSYGASKMRNKVIKDTQIMQMLDFGSYMIFESSDIQTMVMIFKADSENDNYKFDYRRLEGNDLNFNDVLDLLNYNQNSKTVFLNPTIQRNKFIDKPLTFSDPIIDAILNKLSKQSNFKLTENEVANGIHHHHDRVSKDMQKKLGDKFSIGEGIFVLSNEEKNNIPFTENELELIKPSYTTKELGRYYANRKNSEWVIYTDSRFKYPENIKPYINIKKHLDKFQKVITSDNKPYGLHRARDERFFKGEKIIAVRKCIKPTFTYTDFDCYVSATFYVIKTNRINLKCLVALLNSKLLAFWLKYKGKMQGNNYQIDKEPLLELPLKNILENDQKPFIELVDKILTAKKQNPSADTTQWEREIDTLVYKLYDLTDEEIQVVEGNVT